MEERITAAIIEKFFKKLRSSLAVDVAIAGAGPSGLVAGMRLAEAGKNVAIFERKLAPGGGIWGGGMLMNEVVVQDNVLDILGEFGIGHEDIGEGYHTVDSVEMAAGLVFGARRAGAKIFNTIGVEDIVFKDDRVCGVVINWTPVVRLEMHVDPLVVTAKAVLDGTGHPAEIAKLAANKAGVQLDTPTGEIIGEKPMWMESGEASTVANTKRIYPGLFASGMAANNVMGGARMGPIFGGMLLSGAKVADLILEELNG